MFTAFLVGVLFGSLVTGAGLFYMHRKFAKQLDRIEGVMTAIGQAARSATVATTAPPK